MPKVQFESPDYFVTKGAQYLSNNEYDSAYKAFLKAITLGAKKNDWIAAAGMRLEHAMAAAKSGAGPKLHYSDIEAGRAAVAELLREDAERIDEILEKEESPGTGQSLQSEERRARAGGRSGPRAGDTHAKVLAEQELERKSGTHRRLQKSYDRTKPSSNGRRKRRKYSKKSRHKSNRRNTRKRNMRKSKYKRNTRKRKY